MDHFNAIVNNALPIRHIPTATYAVPPSVPEVSSTPYHFDIPQAVARNSKPKTAITDMYLMEDISTEYVSKVAFDINGSKKYLMNYCTQSTWNEKQRDARWFAMHTSKRKGINGLRKVGTCCGSFECVNTQCPKLISGKGVNKFAFTIQRGNRSRTCKICGEEAIQIPCGAKKVMEFHPFRQTLLVYHVGEHKCTLKRDLRKNTLNNN